MERASIIDCSRAIRFGRLSPEPLRFLYTRVYGRVSSFEAILPSHQSECTDAFEELRWRLERGPDSNRHYYCQLLIAIA